MCVCMCVVDSSRNRHATGQTGFLLYTSDISVSLVYAIRLPCYFWNKPVGDFKSGRTVNREYYLFFNQNHQIYSL